MQAPSTWDQTEGRNRHLGEERGRAVLDFNSRQ